MIYIRDHRLFHLADGVEKEYRSQFIAEKEELEAREARHAGWKTRSDQDEGRMIPRAMLWGARGRAGPPQRMRITWVQECGERWYYVVAMSRSQGLFYYLPARDEEIRLFHKEDFDPQGCWVREDRSIITTADDGDGSRHLVRLDGEGRLQEQLTAGDSRDGDPCCHGDRIHYASSGLARGPDGAVAAQGPAAIHVLDLGSRAITTLREDPRFDYLAPRVAADGSVYCLRLPHHRGGYGLGTFALDILLFPYRLLAAGFGFLNAFSLFFAKRPLTAAGGPKLGAVDLRKRVIHARLVDIERESRRAGRPVAAPADWVVVRLRGGEDEIIARHVVSFDLDGAGAVHINDGFAIARDGKPVVAANREAISGFSVARA